MTWIQTYNSVKFDLLDPQPSHVDIIDIAHHLALTMRFNGATREPYSVAQHCCLVSDICPPGLRLAGLLHDAEEAYVGDLTRPLKVTLAALGTRHGLDAIVQKLRTVIGQAFGVELVLLAAEVKHADDVLLATEARDLMGPPPEPWAWLPPPLKEPIAAWHWAYAQRQFLERFHALAKGAHP